MTSKESLKDIFDILVNFERLSDIHDNQDIKKQKFDIVEKDLDQLEEYRKIEKEIGVDFVTLVKMLKDDVYINDSGIVDEIGRIYKEQVKSIEHWPVWSFTTDDGGEYAFKNRGKTWALDKEEFYEKLSK